MIMKKRSDFLVLIFCLMAASGFCTAQASDNVFRDGKNSVKKAGKQFGKDAKSAGKQTGHAGKEVGKGIGKAGKNVGKTIAHETRKLFGK